jgi:hypothetical protein
MAGRATSGNQIKTADQQALKQHGKPAPTSSQADFQGTEPGPSLQQSMLKLQQTAGNRAVQRLLATGTTRVHSTARAYPASLLSQSEGSSSAGVMQTASNYGLGEEEAPGPVSVNGAQGTAPVTPAPTTPVTHVPAAPAEPQTAATAGAVITSKTLEHAPDGAPDTRTTVGVKELVHLYFRGEAAWTASAGRITFEGPFFDVLWTAPEVGSEVTITATPASGTPATLSMTVLPPMSAKLEKYGERIYPAGQAGSGFGAYIDFMPLSVSFFGIEYREESAVARATGYYDTVLHLNGKVHTPSNNWMRVNERNSGPTDTVGTTPPGTPGPFTKGDFIWVIPQSYRAGRSGSPNVFSYNTHLQTMTGPSGEETTDKAGAHRTRTP